MEANQKYNVRLDKIELLDFMFKQKPNKDDKEFELNKYDYNINVENKIFPERELFVQVVTIHLKEHQKNDILAGLTLALGFFVENFKIVFKLEEEKKNM
ncbi:MAG: hypothetical protein IPJ81_08985 [Chitinophagaceae bacterium]|nr:hypothetical protein [Chitinophagaceae bacterium]